MTISTTQHPFLKGLKISAHLAMSACQSIRGAAGAGPTGSLCLLLCIPQLKEANTLLLMLGKKDEALLGHQVYAFSLRSCSFIKPMVEPVPGSGKVTGVGCSEHSEPSPSEKSSQFHCSLLFPHGCLLANPIYAGVQA